MNNILGSIPLTKADYQRLLPMGPRDQPIKDATFCVLQHPIYTNGAELMPHSCGEFHCTKEEEEQCNAGMIPVSIRPPYRRLIGFKFTCGTDVKPSWKSLGVITFISRDYSFSEDWPVAPLEIDGEQHDHLTSRRLYLLRALLAKFFGVRHPLPRVYVEIAQDKAALDLRNNNGPLQLPLTVQIVRIKPQQVAGEVVPLLHAAVGDLVSAAVALAAEEGGYLSAGETSGEVVNVAELSESPAMGYPTTYPMYVRISSDPPRPVNGFVKGVVVPRFWVDEVMYMAPMHYAQAQGHIARGRSKYSLP